MSTGRILVTGASGFIGRALVPELLARSRHVTLAVRTAAACPPSWRTADGLRIVETGPLEQSRNLDEALADVSAVVHLAGLAHVQPRPGEDDRFLAGNAVATERLAAAAARNGVSTFIHLSSLAAVTENASRAIVDDASDTPPATAYGKSKRLAEAHVAALRGRGVFSVNLRPPLVVGSDARGNWAALQRLAATGWPLPFKSLRNRRSMIGVRALVEALLRLCERQWPLDKGGSYCLADPEPLSVAETVMLLRTAMGLPPRMIPCPRAALYGAAVLLGQRQRASGLLGNLEVDSSRFRREFGFAEQQSLRSAIVESGKSYVIARRARSERASSPADA